MRYVRLSVPLLALGVMLGVAALRSEVGKAEVIVETESLYHHIFVEAEGSIRRLLFRRRGVDHSESSVDLNAPLKPLMRYTELMFSGLLYCPVPKDILVIGLGGGMLSRMLSHYFPDANVITVELDPKVFELAKKHFVFKETKRCKVVVRDGRVYVKRVLRNKSPRFDLVLLDAYRGGFIPYHLTTREFMVQCKELLKPGGLVVSNMRTDFKSYDYQRRTVDKVFAFTDAFGGSVGNTVVCSSATGKNVTRAELVRRARALQDKHHFEFDMLDIARARRTAPDYDKRGDIFTDDYAPANILRRK